MIRVWIPTGFWEAFSEQQHSADRDACHALKTAGRRVQVGGLAGGIEQLRRAAAAEANRTGSTESEVRVRRCAQLTLAALARLGWRPAHDAGAFIYLTSTASARTEGSVVPRIRCGWLTDIQLLGDARPRRGHGAKAVKAFEAWALSHDSEVVRLVAPRSQSGFWLRMGYSVVSNIAGNRVRLVRLLRDPEDFYGAKVRAVRKSAR